MSKESTDGLSPAERQAIKDRAKELRAEQKAASGLADMMEKISVMTPEEQVVAKRLHELVMATAPHLVPKTWYGMPAWTRNGKVICFFQAASKFQSRYNTFGFDENANLDEGSWWATSYALTALTREVEEEIMNLVARATQESQP
jgi:uncharacterized protein YdhG (YjbR/CyaY superfamily)